jgi:hypothetical protein
MLGIAATMLLYFKPELRGLGERSGRFRLIDGGPVIQFHAAQALGHGELAIDPPYASQMARTWLARVMGSKGLAITSSAPSDL